MTLAVPILTYHKLGVPSSRSTRRGLHTSPAAFDGHLSFLAQRGFTFCDFQDLLEVQRGSTTLPERPVLLTFDDGHLDTYTRALPLLVKHRAKATVFVVAGDLGRRGLHWPEASDAEAVDLMSWDQAAELQAAGVRIEAHGWSHRRMDRLPAAELRGELQRTRATIRERLGYESIALAYPDGSTSPECASVVSEAGFEFACTTQEGVWEVGSTPALCLPRIAVKGYRWSHGWRFRRRLSALARTAS